MTIEDVKFQPGDNRDLSGPLQAGPGDAAAGRPGEAAADRPELPSDQPADQLIEDFQTALEEGQFQVYYQPKFDLRATEPRLDGAEALVRWAHPDLGMLRPGDFIPLFVDKGLIRALDHYVWDAAARQLREWKDRYGLSVPVSVNVSRSDLHDPNMVLTLMQILEQHKLDAGDLHLEVTEAACAEDSAQVVEALKRLRAIGFAIEMDDFGRGNASLTMLNALPIDALKLDTLFIRSTFGEDQSARLLEIMAEIAENLSVPVIAEGVEEKGQLDALRQIGCDMVQGYYFSPPVPADQFAAYLEELQALQDRAKAARSGGKRRGRKGADGAKTGATDSVATEAAAGEAGGSGMAGKKAGGAGAAGGPAFGAGVMDEAAGGILGPESSIADRWAQKLSIPLSGASAVFVLLAILVAICLFMSNIMVTRGYMEIEQANENYIHAEQASTDLQMASDYLTEQVRLFVMLGDDQYLRNYLRELEVAQRREEAVLRMRTLLQGTGTAAYVHLSAALRLSNELVDYEYHAMKLQLAAGDYGDLKLPAALADYPLSAREQALSDEEKRAAATQLVLGPDYMDYKARIKENTDACAEYLISTAGEVRKQADHKMDLLLTIQTITIIVLLLIVLAIVVFITVWVRNPLSRMVALLKARETVPPAGAGELRFVSETYNAIFEENRRTHHRLTYGNMHDSLTGLYNRKAYDILCQDIDMSGNALIRVDVDRFKTLNDTYGHEVGDRVLKRVSEVLLYSFRPTDLVFRLGADEFAVIMTQVDSAMGDSVRSLIDQANVTLQKPTHDLPSTSLSAGAAFADRAQPEGDIFKDADTALRQIKEAGRCGCYIY